MTGAKRIIFKGKVLLYEQRVLPNDTQLRSVHLQLDHLLNGRVTPRGWKVRVRG